MDRPTPPNESGDRQQLNELIAEGILALERGGERALDELLAQAPQHAARVRARIEGLKASGLIAPPVADPEAIGPYRILQRLGAGGMGTVYLAEQRHPVERRVAIKVIRPGMDTREVLARFAVERQALAMLDHQHLAKVLDAGATDDGRPFLVMEYVPGVPITRYCDDRRLAIEQRIDLFCRVCDAVQHAHHKGLIHRDLKPSNILVADRDGRPWPIVIDFGVAKSLSVRLRDVTLVTVRGHVLGTPEYMSPEQAASDMDIDTRADVFSLGVILYELLTGTLPIGSQVLRRASSDELPRVLRDTATVAPSRRAMETTAETAELVAKRGTTNAALCRRLRGDLDWITLRALERDRNRRYGMPGELAADLQRHLRSEPVSAGPPSALYRCRKFLARNRLQAVSAAVVLVSLVGGLLFSTSAYRAAEASARQSDADFEQAMAAVERLVFVADEQLVDEPQMDGVRRQLLEDALHFYQRIAAGRSDARELGLRVVHARASVGLIQHSLGNLDAALAALDQVRQQVTAIDPAGGTDHRTLLATIEHNRGTTLFRLGRTHEAEAALRAANLHLRSLAATGGDHGSDRILRWRLQTLEALGDMLCLHDLPAARETYEEGLAIAGPTAGSADPTVRAAVMSIAADHVGLMLEMGERELVTARAEELQPRMLEFLPDLVGRARSGVIGAAIGMAKVLNLVGRPAQAVTLLEQALRDQRQYCADHPALITGYTGLGLLLESLAGVQLATQDFAQALGTQRECARVYEQLHSMAAVPAHQAALGRALVHLARAYDNQRSFAGETDAAAADAALQRGTGLLQSLPAELRTMRESREAMATACWLRARSHESAGRLEAAIADLEQSVDESRALAEATPASVLLQIQFADNSWDLLRVLVAAREWARARAIADRIVDLAPLFAKTGAAHAAIDFEQRVRRCRMQALAGLGDVEGVLAEVRRPSGLDEDWLSVLRKAEALLLLVAHLPAADARSPALLGEARTLLRGQLEAEGAADASMVAVMAAQAWEVLVRVERAAGDLAAAATAAETAVRCYGPSFRERPGERTRGRLLRAADTWLQILAERRDAAALAAAVESLTIPCAGDGRALLHLAGWWGRLCQLDGDPEAAARARDRGVALLRASVTTGSCDAATLERSLDLAPLRSHPAFPELVAAARK